MCLVLTFQVFQFITEKQETVLVYSGMKKTRIIHSPSSTWNQKMMVSKKESPIPFGAVFRVHVKIWEGIFAIQDNIWLVRTTSKHLRYLIGKFSR